MPFVIMIIVMEDTMDEENIRNKLSDVMNRGLSAVAISRVTGIGKIDLSRFKNRQINLISEDLDRLEKYLNLVQIPTSI